MRSIFRHLCPITFLVFVCSPFILVSEAASQDLSGSKLQLKTSPTLQTTEVETKVSTELQETDSLTDAPVVLKKPHLRILPATDPRAKAILEQREKLLQQNAVDDAQLEGHE